MEQETLSILEINFNKHPSLIYSDNRNTKTLASNLLLYALNIFADTYRIKYINEYSTLEFTLKEKDIEKAKPFCNENIVDHFKIITCFENYMKAKLLDNGYVVHNIKAGDAKNISNDEKYKHLHNKQKKMPVALSELTLIEDFIMRPNEKVKVFLPGIINNTVSINTMLKSRYQKVIQFPENVLKTIKALNEHRNTHHFFIFEYLTMTDSTVKDLVELKEFVDTEMVLLYTKLQSEIPLFDLRN
jgi:hypothetical protein